MDLYVECRNVLCFFHHKTTMNVVYIYINIYICSIPVLFSSLSEYRFIVTRISCQRRIQTMALILKLCLTSLRVDKLIIVVVRLLVNEDNKSRSRRFSNDSTCCRPFLDLIKQRKAS